MESIVAPESIIRVLPDTLANKIAAGEVVQRPSSVEKELVENAIDAGATNVTVLLKKAGSELIQVMDDGCGMSAHDAITCFQRHATSKIQSIEDLERLCTLGFRGEALASIGAVAQVELKTKRVQDEAGVCVRVEGGKVRNPEPCATPNGTSLAVKNLFYNVPARRNFLKSPATEFKHLVETFQFLALSNPTVGFTLVHDGSEVYRSAAPTDLVSPLDQLRLRIVDLFGAKYRDQLVPVAEETSYLSLRGFVAKPDFSRKSRGEQFFFVNGRYVAARALDHAVTHGYGEMLPKGAYPFYVLFLQLDPKHVDVNVHPTKTEVKFDDERGVYGFVRAVVKKALGEHDITPHVGYNERGRLVEQTPATVGTFSSPPAPRPGGSASRFEPDSIPRPVSPSRFTGADRSEPARLLFGDAAPSEPVPGETQHTVVAAGERPEAQTAAEADAHTEERLLWQLHNRYVLTQIRSGLMIMDQHAAHERILYEKALTAMRSGFGLSQQLLFPQTLEFGPSDHALLQELLPDLRALGFDVEIFGGRSVIVRGVPADVPSGDERHILDGLLEQYKEYRDTLNLKGRENIAASLACRSAIKSGQRLSPGEMRKLVDQLFACEMPYACPHGRPTMIKITIEELDKRFGRIGHLERE